MVPELTNYKSHVWANFYVLLCYMTPIVLDQKESQRWEEEYDVIGRGMSQAMCFVSSK